MSLEKEAKKSVPEAGNRLEVRLANCMQLGKTWSSSRMRFHTASAHHHKGPNCDPIYVVTMSADSHVPCDCAGVRSIAGTANVAHSCCAQGLLFSKLSCAQGTQMILGGMMVVRAGLEGVSYRFPETNFGDHATKDVVSSCVTIY